MRARVALAAAVLALLGVATPAAAEHRTNPTAGEVSRAQQAARERAAAVGAAEARLALADAALQRVGAAAERMVEAYNGARVALGRARAAAQAADAAAQAADAEVAAQRAAMGRLAAASYRSGGNLVLVGALLSADGASGFLQGAGMVQQISRKQADRLGTLHAAEVIQRVAQQASRASLEEVAAAAAKAERARAEAAAAVARQQQQVATLSGQREQLALEAAAARERAGQLAAARTAYLAAARERALREAAEQRARELAEQAKAKPEPVNEPPVYEGGDPARGNSTAGQGQTAVEYAKAQVGKPYQWAADGPDSFDCSGLTMMAWRQAGIRLDHYSVAQWDQGRHVSRDQLRAGDLVFFADDTSDPSTIHHVGIYVGDGRMISAPQTGDVVKYSSVDRSGYIGATRP